MNVATNATHIANVNPLRYRSYFYDAETGWYRLNTRYYNPVVGRFINADGLLSTGQGFLGHNMFAYCGNNPVARDDIGGELWGSIFGGIVTAVSAVTPVGWAVIVTSVVVIGTVIVYAEHTKNARPSTRDKHTKPRPGRQSEKKKQKPGWKRR